MEEEKSLPMNMKPHDRVQAFLKIIADNTELVAMKEDLKDAEGDFYLSVVGEGQTGGLYFRSRTEAIRSQILKILQLKNKFQVIPLRPMPSPIRDSNWGVIDQLFNSQWSHTIPSAATQKRMSRKR